MAGTAVWRSCCRAVFERWTAGFALTDGGPGAFVGCLADEPRLSGSIGSVRGLIGQPPASQFRGLAQEWPRTSTHTPTLAGRARFAGGRGRDSGHVFHYQGRRLDPRPPSPSPERVAGARVAERLLEGELLVGRRLERQPVQRRDAEALDRLAVLGGRVADVLGELPARMVSRRRGACSGRGSPWRAPRRPRSRRSWRRRR